MKWFIYSCGSHWYLLCISFNQNRLVANWRHPSSFSVLSLVSLDAVWKVNFSNSCSLDPGRPEHHWWISYWQQSSAGFCIFSQSFCPEKDFYLISPSQSSKWRCVILTGKNNRRDWVLQPLGFKSNYSHLLTAVSVCPLLCSYCKSEQGKKKIMVKIKFHSAGWMVRLSCDYGSNGLY